MASELQSVFTALRAILERHAPGFRVSHAFPQRYALEASIGPATLRAWRGKAKRPHIPVAWVSMEKTYVSYHLMGAEHPTVRKMLSAPLAAHVQGKTCFNFKTEDPALLSELEEVTKRALEALRDAGFIVAGESA
jgi:hypothetical protein